MKENNQVQEGAPSTEQEAEVGRYLFEAFTGQKQSVSDEDEAPDSAVEKPAEDPTESEHYLAAKAEAKRHREAAEELQRKLDELSSLSPIDLLKSLGKKPEDVIQAHMSEDSDPEQDRVTALEAKIAEMEAEKANAAQAEQRNAAKKRMTDYVSAEEHFWLSRRDDPAEEILTMLESEYKRTGEIVSPGSVAKKLEEKYAAEAQRYIDALEEGKGKGRDQKASLPAANLRNVGGTRRKASFDELPLEEKERIAAQQMQELFQAAG